MGTHFLAKLRRERENFDSQRTRTRYEVRYEVRSRVATRFVAIEKGGRPSDLGPRSFIFNLSKTCCFKPPLEGSCVGAFSQTFLVGRTEKILTQRPSTMTYERNDSELTDRSRGVGKLTFVEKLPNNVGTYFAGKAFAV